MNPLPDEAAVMNLGRVEMRLFEAFYFFQEFERHCGVAGQSNDNAFRWVAYSDAFLVSLLSVQDFLRSKKRALFLRGYVALTKSNVSVPKPYFPNPLLVLKFMRNQSVHRCVFAAPGGGRGKGPVSRVIHVETGARSASRVEPKIEFSHFEDLIRRVMDKHHRDKKSNKPTRSAQSDIKEVRLYLQRLRKEGKQQLFLKDIFREGYDAALKVCGLESKLPALN